MYGLNSFDLAGWPASDHPGQSVHDVPSSGAPILLDNITIKGAGPSHSSFTPGLTAQSIAIDFGFNDDNVGIDNINFDQIATTAPVFTPEPSTFLLAGIALAVWRLKLKR